MIKSIMQKKFMVIAIFILTVGTLALTSCAAIGDFLTTTKGSLLGQEFKINTYSNSGELTMTTKGNKINIGLYKGKQKNDSESADFKSEVLDIAIDGSQILSVGSTLVFEEKGIDTVKDFQYDKLKDINATSGGGIVSIDRLINNVKNSIGKKRIVVVSSQLGNPICVYQGDEVFVTVPTDLPKMTRLNIDGKSLYVHRANYQIIDSKLIQ